MHTIWAFVIMWQHGIFWKNVPELRGIASFHNFANASDYDVNVHVLSVSSTSPQSEKLVLYIPARDYIGYRPLKALC
jgi:hypothetical protein